MVPGGSFGDSASAATTMAVTGSGEPAGAASAEGRDSGLAAAAFALKKELGGSSPISSLYLELALVRLLGVSVILLSSQWYEKAIGIQLKNGPNAEETGRRATLNG